MNNQNIYKVIVISVGVFVLSILALLVLVALTIHNVPPNQLAADFFPEWRSILRPEQETTYFHFFVLTAFIVQVITVRLFRKYLK